MFFLPSCQMLLHRVANFVVDSLIYFFILNNYFSFHVAMFNTYFVATGSISCDSL